MVLKLEHFENTRKVLKCGAEDEWRSLGPIVRKTY
jgi:hypothetical protein